MNDRHRLIRRIKLGEFSRISHTINMKLKNDEDNPNQLFEIFDVIINGKSEILGMNSVLTQSEVQFMVDADEIIDELYPEEVK